MSTAPLHPRSTGTAPGDTPVKALLNSVRPFVLLAAVAVTAGGMYWSFKTHSSIPLSSFFPAWLDAWTDNHGVIRNIPAYFVLSVLWLIWCANRKERLFAMMTLASFATLVEVSQVWMPHRFASVLDVLCSWAGILLAWGFCRAGRRLGRRLLAGPATGRADAAALAIAPSPARDD